MTGRDQGPNEGPPEEPDSGSDGAPDADQEFDQEAFDTAFAEAFGDVAEPERPEGDSGAPGATSAAEALAPGAGRRLIAVVLTPIRSAAALAGLCAMASIEAEIIPSKNGALAVRVLPAEAADDPEMLLTGAPGAATELAATLSRTAKAGVVLLTAQLGEGEEGLTGTITGRKYTGGEPGEEVPAGLVLANADDVLEALLLGTLAPQDAPGRVGPDSAPPWRSGRLSNKPRRRKRQ